MDNLSPKAQMRIMNLCKGMKIKDVEHRLNVMSAFVAQKQVGLRMRLVGLKIGD